MSTTKKPKSKPLNLRVYKTAGRVASAKVSTLETWQDIVNKAMNPIVAYLKKRSKK